jgi:hypothetical protein
MSVRVSIQFVEFRSEFSRRFCIHGNKHLGTFLHSDWAFGKARILYSIREIPSPQLYLDVFMKHLGGVTLWCSGDGISLIEYFSNVTTLCLAWSTRTLLDGFICFSYGNATGVKFCLFTFVTISCKDISIHFAMSFSLCSRPRVTTRKSWKDLPEILYWKIILKSVKVSPFWLKSDDHNGHLQIRDDLYVFMLPSWP